MQAGLTDALKGFFEDLISGAADDLGSLIKTIADFTYWNPHPEFDTAQEVIMLPDKEVWGIWGQLMGYHFETAAPIATVILILVWFMRRAGVATGMLGERERVESNRNLISGIIAIYLSFHAVAIYLNLSQILVTAIAPPEGAFDSIAFNFVGVSGGAALAVVFLNVSINATLLIILVLLNAARILATFMLPILGPYAIALHFGRVPLLTDQVKKIFRLLASAPLWTLPVAAGWRLMVILGGQNDSDIGSYIVAQAGIDQAAGSGVAADLITSSMLMVPVIIGILAPLKMTGAASSIYYMSRMAGVSFGKKADSGSPGDDGGNAGEGSNEGENGGGSGNIESGSGSGSGRGSGSGGVPSTGSERSSGSSSNQGGSGPTGGRSSGGVVAQSTTGTDGSLFEDAKDAFNPIPDDTEYVDRERVDVAKRAGSAAIGAAKNAPEAAANASGRVQEGGKNARRTAAAVKNNPSIDEPDSYDIDAPGGRVETLQDRLTDSNIGPNVDSPEGEPIMNGSEDNSPDVSPAVPDETKLDPAGVDTKSDPFSTTEPTPGYQDEEVTGTGANTFSISQDDDIYFSEDAEAEPNADQWQDMSPTGPTDTRSSDGISWLSEDNSIASQLERDD